MLAGTVAVPCFVVTTMTDGRDACAGGTSMLAMEFEGRTSTFSTGAQSIPEQHSLSYQSWAFARCASVIKATNTAKVAMTTRITSLPQRSPA